MSEIPPNPELLRSLGKLVRGLSALFWGLPAALIVCAGTTFGGWFRAFNIAPVMVTTGLILYGLWQIGAFQKQERPWRIALDRARLMALINFGLSPFLFWWNRMPDNSFFVTMVALFAVTSLLFLFNLNLVIARLGEMIPDETLRQETRQFTVINRTLLIIVLAVASCLVFLIQMQSLPQDFREFLFRLQRIGQHVLLLLVLLPLSLTMSLLWKTKEVIMDSLFTQR
jgi:hypothetical protein